MLLRVDVVGIRDTQLEYFAVCINGSRYKL